VTTMMDEVHLNNQPSTNPSTSYTFIVSCKETKDCADGTLAVSDSRPPSADFTPIIRLCPAFFDPNTPQTKNDLSSKEIKRDPGRRDSSWCQPDQPFSFFETAGHTIFHEMTHLDQLGRKSHHQLKSPFTQTEGSLTPDAEAAGLSPRDVAGQ